jgi:CheY-like chemotaxis protein
VEDDPGMREFVNRVLTEAGFDVTTVANGVDALKMLRSRPRVYDLVVLDLILPWVNGLEVLASIRAETALRHLPVLVTTGTVITPNQFAGDALVSVLRKPFDDQQLIGAVGTTLHGARFLDGRRS